HDQACFGRQQRAIELHWRINLLNGYSFVIQTQAQSAREGHTLSGVTAQCQFNRLSHMLGPNILPTDLIGCPQYIMMLQGRVKLPKYCEWQIHALWINTHMIADRLLQLLLNKVCIPRSDSGEAIECLFNLRI